MSSTARAKIFKTNRTNVIYVRIWGLNMVHISTEAKALKIAWIKRFLEGDRDCGWK